MNKRLTVLFSLLAVAVILVVLFCAVFVVREIEIAGVNGYEPDAAKILADSKLVQGVNIFTVSESKATENVELLNPLVKVVKIERKFPDKVIVHVDGRIPLFSVKTAEGKFAFVDRELKVLEIRDAYDGGYTAWKGYVPDNLGADSVGDYFKKGDARYDTVRTIVSTYEKFDKTGVRFNRFIVEIDLSVDGKTVLSTVNGVKIEIIGSKNIAEQVEYSYAFFNEKLTDAQRSGGVITNEGAGWLYKN